MRRLLSTRRIIPLDRLDEYLAAWARLREAFVAAGGRAWLFRAGARQDHFIEFLEFGGREDILERDNIVEAREVLDEEFGEGQVEEWEEAPTS
jgi:hypothetical protein